MFYSSLGTRNLTARNKFTKLVLSLNRLSTRLNKLVLSGQHGISVLVELNLNASVMKLVSPSTTGPTQLLYQQYHSLFNILCIFPSQHLLAVPNICSFG